MFCTPAATTRSARTRQHRLRGEVHRLLRRAALTVDRRARHFVGHAGDEPTCPCDVARLRTDRVDASEHDVVDRGGVDVDAVEERSNA